MATQYKQVDFVTESNKRGGKRDNAARMWKEKRIISGFVARIVALRIGKKARVARF